MANNNRPTVKTRFGTCATGIQKLITGNVTIDGVTYTATTLAAVFLDAIRAMDTADASHKKWLDDVQAMNAAKAKADGVFSLLQSYVVSQYGKTDNSALAVFGMTPRKTTATSSATKAAAAKKAKATRTVRHTMGTQQRKQVKGTVEVPVTEVPVTLVPAAGAPSQPAPAPPPSPAPAPAPPTPSASAAPAATAAPAKPAN
jgi:hypothetical protein